MKQQGLGYFISCNEVCDNEVCDTVYDGQYLKYPYDQIDSDDILNFAEKERDRKHRFLTKLALIAKEQEI